jgi:phage gp36-like protein
MAYIDIDYLAGLAGSTELAKIAARQGGTADLGNPTTIATIEQAIERVSRIVDTYLRPVYSGILPLASVPEELKDAVAWLSFIDLREATERLSEVHAEKKLSIERWLSRLAAGKVQLDLEGDGDYTTPDTGINSNLTYEDRRFSRDTLENKF